MKNTQSFLSISAFILLLIFALLIANLFCSTKEENNDSQNQVEDQDDEELSEDAPYEITIGNTVEEYRLDQIILSIPDAKRYEPAIYHSLSGQDDSSMEYYYKFFDDDEIIAILIPGSFTVEDCSQSIESSSDIVTECTFNFAIILHRYIGFLKFIATSSSSYVSWAEQYIQSQIEDIFLGLRYREIFARINRLASFDDNTHQAIKASLEKAGELVYTVLPQLWTETFLDPSTYNYQTNEKPKIELSKYEIYKENIFPNEPVNDQITITNAGYDDLYIVGYRSECNCNISNKNEIIMRPIKPGESRVLDLNFRAPDNRGTMSRILTLITNDPARTRLDIEIFVEVVIPE